MKLSIHMHSLHEIDDFVALAKRADEIGLAEIRIAERIDHHYATWPTLFMMAMNTQRIGVGPSVTNPYSRHPAITAKMIAFLDHYSEGRALLGMGQGDMWQFTQLGIKPEKPIRALREAMQLMQHLLSGDEAAYEGQIFFAPEGFNFPFRPYGDDIPMFIGSRSPGGMALAGQIADELHLPNCVAAELIAVAQEKLREGMQKGGRDGDLTSLASSPHLSLSSDRDAAIKRAQREIGRFIEWQNYPIELMGVEPELVNKLTDAYRREDYEYLYKNVDERLLEAFTLAGTPADVIEQIERLAALGIQHITFNELAPDLEEALTLLEKEIVPHFAN